MLGAADVGGVGVAASAGDVAELTAQRVAAARGVRRTGRAGGGLLLSRLLLLVLLALQMLTVRLKRSGRSAVPKVRQAGGRVT